MTTLSSKQDPRDDLFTFFLYQSVVMADGYS